MFSRYSCRPERGLGARFALIAASDIEASVASLPRMWLAVFQPAGAGGGDDLGFDAHTGRGLPQVAAVGGEAFVERFAAAMDDDFGTPEAVAVLFEMAREINRLRDSEPAAAAGLAARLRELAGLLGVLQLDADEFLQAGAAGKVDAAQVEALIQARLDARAAKNWAESDRIRDELTALGVVLEDGKGGTTWRLAE